MSIHSIDWELRDGLALRRNEAIEAAERERLVRELRAARRARRPYRPPWWKRHTLLRRGSRKELVVGR